MWNKCRPLGNTELTALQKHCGKVLRSWLRKHGIASEDINVEVIPQKQVNLSVGEGVVFSADKLRMVLKGENAFRQYFLSQLLSFQASENEQSELLLAMWQKAYKTLMQQMFGVAADSNQSNVFEHGFFGAQCVVKVDDLELCQLFLPVELVDQQFAQDKQSKPMQGGSIYKAVSDNQLSVKVGLFGSKLSIEQLSKVQVGDVITLEAPLEKPLEIQTESGATIAGAYLGKNNHQKAVCAAKLV